MGFEVDFGLVGETWTSILLAFGVVLWVQWQPLANARGLRTVVWAEVSQTVSGFLEN